MDRVQVETESPVVIPDYLYLGRPPHFWGTGDSPVGKRYAKADIPMLPVTHGRGFHQDPDFTLYNIAFCRYANAFCDSNEWALIYLAGAISLGVGIFCITRSNCIGHKETECDRNEKLLVIRYFYLRPVVCFSSS